MSGLSREQLLRRGAAGAALVAAAGPLAGRAVAKLGRAGPTDLELVGLALRLERVQHELYTAALEHGRGLGSSVKGLARELRDQEAAHAHLFDQLITQLGGKSDPPPRVHFGASLSSQRSFLRLAQRLEDLAVASLDGLAPLVEQQSVLVAVGRIVQVEARQAAAVRLLRREPPAAGPFEPALGPDEADRRLTRLLRGLS